MSPRQDSETRPISRWEKKSLEDLPEAVPRPTESGTEDTPPPNQPLQPTSGLDADE